jgi:hypothetical protein
MCLALVRIASFTLFLLFFPSAGFAAASFTASEPVLLTSAGQSADVNMAKVLFDRNKVAQKSAPLAGPDDLAGMKTLVVVIGGSTKGLGAAGLDTGKEAARVERLMAAAAAQKIPIIGMHIGGKARRGDLSDRFIALVAPRAAFFLAIREGDFDGFLTKMITGHNLNALMVDKLANLQEPIKTVFGK